MSAPAFWMCVNCRSEFRGDAAAWRQPRDPAFDGPACPNCDAGNQFTRLLTPLELVRKIDQARFESGGGPLTYNAHWKALRAQLKDLDQTIRSLRESGDRIRRND